MHLESAVQAPVEAPRQVERRPVRRARASRVVVLVRGKQTQGKQERVKRAPAGPVALAARKTRAYPTRDARARSKSH